MTNPLRKRLQAGKTCVNGWSLLPSSFAVEFMAKVGWDSITVDIQHGLHDYRSAAECFQAMTGYPVTPLVRVPWNEPGIIGKVLDAGAWGIICPMINTAEDAKALVRASLYPPAGERSNGPIRAGGYGVPGAYQGFANDEVLILPQIETAQAVENLEAILDVPGVSGVYVGPSDLGFSMGLPPILDREEPEILAIYERVLAAAAARGKFTGIQNLTPAYAARMAQMGFGIVTVSSDVELLAFSAYTAVNATRAAAGERAAP